MNPIQYKSEGICRLSLTLALDVPSQVRQVEIWPSQEVIA